MLAALAGRRSPSWTSLGLLAMALATAGCAADFWPLAPRPPEELAEADEAPEASVGDAAEPGQRDPSDPAEPQLPSRETLKKLRRDLSSPQATARVAALQALADDPPVALPEEAIAALGDPDARVRGEALSVVAAVATRAAARNEDVAKAGAAFEESRKRLIRGLRDESRDVRHAAMRGLGRLGDEASLAKLRELWEREPELSRVALVESFAAAHDRDSLLKAADDRVWQVRAAVAKALGALEQDAATRAALVRLAGDASSVVQVNAVETVAKWPVEAASEVWFTAMERGGAKARLAAQQAFAKYWPPAADFDAEAHRDERLRALAELKHRWRAERHGAVQLASAVASSERGIAPDVERALGELRAAQVSSRRLAAQSLVAAARRGPLGPEACQRLGEALRNEDDAEVWRGVLDSLSGDVSPEATRLVLLATGHSAGDIRRRACDYLALHPAAESAAHLLELLRDPEIAVSRAAAKALGVCPSGDDAQRIGAELLEQTAARDGPLRLAASVSLAQRNHPSGLAAIERLAYDADLNVRLGAVRALGETGDPAAAGALVELLDEAHGVGVAALRCLRQLTADPETGAPPVAAAAQAAEIEAWKAWWASRGASPQPAP